jgi:type I restriction enzyme R subunit
VRPKRRYVEAYAKATRWKSLDHDARKELVEHVAGLPSEKEPEAEETKRFDLLLLNLELALLRHKPVFERLRKQVVTIAALLEEKAAIPLVAAQMALIQELQTDEWWQDVTLPMLELVRKRLRELVPLIEKAQRKPLYTDFVDVIGDELEIELIGPPSADDFERFRAKARVFLRAHEDHLAIHKLRMNQPLTASDVAELERMLVASGVGGSEALHEAAVTNQGLGLFVRSLVGLDREAAKHAFTGFAQKLDANQIEFVSLVIDYLTEHGDMPPERLYESPFTDRAPTGPAELLGDEATGELISLLERIRGNALAA